MRPRRSDGFAARSRTLGGRNPRSASRTSSGADRNRASSVCSDVDSVSPAGRVITILSGARSTARSSAIGSITTPCGRGKRVEFDEILLVDEAARRRQRGDDVEHVAGFRIDEPVHALRLVEPDRNAGAVRSDQVAGDVDRVGRIDNRVADGDGPDRTGGRSADQMRTIERKLDDVGIVLMGDRIAANGAARLAVEPAQVDARPWS